MHNSITLVGRLTKDVVLNQTQNGKSVARFAMAVDRPVVKGREKETDFINIVTFGVSADNCEKYLGKGRLVMVTGRLEIRYYNLEDGKGDRKAVEVMASKVVFLDKAPDNAEVKPKAKPKTKVKAKAEVNNDDYFDNRYDEYDEAVPF